MVTQEEKLSVKQRECIGKKLSKLRKEGWLPAVIYGNDKKSMAIQINSHEFDLLYRKAGGNTVITIEIEKSDGNKEKRKVLAYVVDKDPVSDKILHTDLFEVNMKEKLTTNVPLKFIGDAEAVINLDGALLTQMNEVEVECLPADLPREIEVSLESLVDFDAVIRVSDLILPQGIIVLNDPEETIVYVEEPRSEEEMAELEAPIVAEEMPPSEAGTPETEESEEVEKEK